MRVGGMAFKLHVEPNHFISMFATDTRRKIGRLSSVQILRKKIYDIRQRCQAYLGPLHPETPCYPTQNPLPNPVISFVQCMTFIPPHSLSPFPSAHVRNSMALLAISNASGGRPFTKMLQFLSSAMHSPSLPLSSSVSTHSDNVSTSFCTDCSLGEASCVLAMICDVVDTMAARWSRMSGASAEVRMAETRAWMEEFSWSVRDSRKV